MLRSLSESSRKLVPKRRRHTPDTRGSQLCAFAVAAIITQQRRAEAFLKLIVIPRIRIHTDTAGTHGVPMRGSTSIMQLDVARR